MSAQGALAYYRLRTAQQYFDSLPDQLDSRQQQWLEQTVDRQLTLEQQVLASAEAAGVTVPKVLQQQALAEIQQQFDDQQAFEASLESLDLDVERFGTLLERQLRVEAVLERQSAAVPRATKDEAQVYYEAHPDKFTKPERRRAWHLLITVNEEFAENSAAAARARLEQIRAETTGDLALFKKRAKRYSECPSALSEGEMGWIPRGHLFPQIDAALFELAEGEVTEVIETEVGLHLVYCEAIETFHQIPFDEVVERLRDKLTEAACRKAQQEWLRSLS